MECDQSDGLFISHFVEVKVRKSEQGYFLLRGVPRKRKVVMEERKPSEATPQLPSILEYQEKGGEKENGGSCEGSRSRKRKQLSWSDTRDQSSSPKATWITHYVRVGTSIPSLLIDFYSILFYFLVFHPLGR